MSVSKPIIAIMSNDSEIGNMVNENNLGKQFSSKEVNDIAKYIIAIKDNKETYDLICNNVRNKFKEKFERKKVTKRFYDIIVD